MAGNALVAKKIVLTAAYVPVSASTKVSSCALLAASDNAGVAYIRGDDGATDVPIPRGIAFRLEGVDLSQIYLKGTLNDVVVLLGGDSGR